MYWFWASTQKHKVNSTPQMGSNQEKSFFLGFAISENPKPRNHRIGRSPPKSTLILGKRFIRELGFYPPELKKASKTDPKKRLKNGLCSSDFVISGFNPNSTFLHLRLCDFWVLGSIEQGMSAVRCLYTFITVFSIN